MGFWQTLTDTFGPVGPLSMAWRMIKDRPPPPYFGSPCLRAAKPNESWWCIPITIQISLPWQKKEIGHCKARLMDSPQSTGIHLAWTVNPYKGGDDKVTLMKGETLLLPIAFRRDGDTKAYLTNLDYVTKEPNKKWNRDPGNYTFYVELRSGEKKWSSPFKYILTIPSHNESDAHFRLEIENEVGW